MKQGVSHLLAAALIYPLTGSVPAFAWAPQGHEIIAAIARAHLTPAARAKSASLLGGDSMFVLVASWADEVRDARSQTAPWHYVDIPLDAKGYDPRRDCPGGQCVVAQIEYDARKLGDANAAKPARAEALRFLIHFVGDVHQPLHAADHGDHGGNDVIVHWGRQRGSLHHVWDQTVVAALGADAMTVAQNIDASLTPGQRLRDSGGAPADWANESLADARVIYGQINGPYLARDYAQRQRALVTDRLAKAGLRLAALLNKILK